MLLALSSELRDLWRARRLLAMMARRELAARHAGSALGILWLYAQPLLTVGAYYLVFDVVFEMKLGESAPTRAVGLYLIVGMVAWIAFAESISRGMASLLDAGSLLQKNPLPPALFPARALATVVAVYLPIGAVLIIAYSPLHRFGIALALLPLLLLLTLTVWFLIAYTLAVLSAAVRDVVQITGFLLGIGVFVSPVLFPPAMFPAGFTWLLWLNPATPTVLGLHALVLTGQAPGPEVWFALMGWTLALALLLDRLAARSREQLVDWL